MTTEQVVVVGYRGRRPNGATVIRLASGERQLEVDAIEPNGQLVVPPSILDPAGTLNDD
jgi:hypothetical protein